MIGGSLKNVMVCEILPEKENSKKCSVQLDDLLFGKQPDRWPQEKVANEQIVMKMTIRSSTKNQSPKN